MVFVVVDSGSWSSYDKISNTHTNSLRDRTSGSRGVGCLATPGEIDELRGGEIMPIVRVTEDHISRGVKGSCVDCPIALAINEQLHPYPTALVGDGYITFRFMHNGDYIKVDREFSARVRKFVNDFDHGHKVEPFNMIF